MPKTIKKNQLTSLDEIYNLIGTSHQNIRYWRNQHTSASTKNSLKYNVINRAGKLFWLSASQMEELANKAGLSLDYKVNSKAKSPLPKEEYFKIEFVSEMKEFPYITNSIRSIITPSLYDIEKISGFVNDECTEIDFVKYFNTILLKYPNKLLELCQYALVSDRMLRHIRTGKHLKKEPILALLIVLEQSLENIQIALRKAGYILSKSLPSDIVIMWILENESHKFKGSESLYRINEELWSLELPLLMTREKT